MEKNIYLTPKEQRIFGVIGKKDVITHEEIEDMFPREKAMNKSIHGLIGKGYLCKLRRGLYATCPEGSLAIGDPFSIASRMYGGYIGLSSALKLHGLLDYEAFTVFSITSGKSEERKFGEYTFKAVNFGDRATGQCLMGKYYVSTLEKTFFDCFYRPGYVGYGELTKAIFQANGVDWEVFLGYFRRFASDSMCQRAGYVLDSMKEKGFKVPGSVIGYFSGRIKTRTRLLPSYRPAGTYAGEWKVMDNLGKEKFLSWWYDG